MPGRLVQRVGAGGYMVDVQVADLAGLVSRAETMDIQPLFVQDFHQHRISQWHPKVFGTLAEFDQVEPAETWHFAPEIFQGSCTTVARDIVGAQLSVADPEAMAQRWASVIDAPLHDARTLPLGDSTLQFVPVEGRQGLTAVDLVPTDASRVGETVHLAGVDFRFVSASR